MLRQLVLFGATLSLLAPAQAAVAAVVSYSTSTVTSSTDTSWLAAPPGSTEVVAFNVGGGQTTFGGLAWLDTTSAGGVYNVATDVDFYYSQPGVAWASTANVFYSGGPQLLNDGGYWPSNTNGSVDLNGFTVGQEYLVQFVFADTRYDGGTLTVLGVSGVTGNSTPTTYSFTDGRYLVVTARFTADTANTTWIPSANGGTGEQLNGIRIAMVPEPGSLALAALGLATAGWLRLRQKRPSRRW